MNISSKCARLQSYQLRIGGKYALRMQNGDYIVLSVVADAMLEDKITDLCPEYPCLYDVHRFVHTFLCEALKRLRLRRIKRRSNISSSDEDESNSSSQTTAAMFHEFI